MNRLQSHLLTCAALLAGVLLSLPATAQRTASREVRELDRVVAVVNTDVITALELAVRVRAVEMQLRRQNIEVPPDDVLRSQVLERMITDRAQIQHAREQGLRVDDAQLDRSMARIAEQNRISMEQLRSRVERDGVPYANFREDIRTEMIVGRLREREVDSRMQVSEADVDAMIAEQQSRGDESTTEYNIAQILLRVPEAASTEQIERQKFRAQELVTQLARGVDFARLAASFSDAPDAMNGGVLGWRTGNRIPELFLDAVRKLKPGEVASVVRSPNGFHVLKLLEKRDTGNRLTGEPVQQTRARHILIRISELVSETEALRRLREIKDRIERGGADFADLAKQYSSDGTASRGGELGWVYPGDTVPEFERVMDALEPGKISDPVRSPFGIHLIQVLERRTDTASNERVRLAARQMVRERRAEEAYQDWLRQLRDRTYVEYKLEEK